LRFAPLSKSGSSRRATFLKSRSQRHKRITLIRPKSCICDADVSHFTAHL
jgi:hypothetical protein